MMGDNPPSDIPDNYGTALNQLQDLLYNTSGASGSVPLGMEQAFWEDNTWIFGGNHDVYLASGPSGPYGSGAVNGLESWRFNQHGRTLNDAGAAYTDADERAPAPAIGNNRFLMVGWVYTDSWARGVVADAAVQGQNLFFLTHAPLPGSTRQSYANNISGALDRDLAASDYVATFCGHTHNYSAGQGLDDACIGTRADYPTRASWDIGASLASPLVPIRRPLRAGGRSLRGIRI
jgi:hypothetical protein